MDKLDSASLDIEKLNETDKAQLRQFLQNENQKARIYSSVHSLTDMCFRKCITGTIKNDKLDKNEEGCLANCAERFFDLRALTVKHLQDMRQD
ncbi:Tim10/DDP family zinc finger protein [Nemania sp. FL0031]|nr:Tim10/DDP family zinc finger protein [Nemania sp. FL0031]